MLSVCRMCGRRSLRPKDLLRNPFNVTFICTYCGAEYKVTKNFIHFIIVFLIWILTFVAFFLLTVFNFDGILKLILSFIILIISFTISVMIGNLDKISRLRK